MTESPTPRQAVIERLHEVFDPCSCMANNPVSIVDLGIVDGVEIDGPSVYIRLLPTTPFCTYMPQIMDETEMEVLKLDGVEEVDIEQNYDDIWRPERMADHLKEGKAEGTVPKSAEAPDAS